jgi:transposase
MDTMYQRCAALDVHKKTITACVRTPDGNGGRQAQVRTFETFLDALEALRDWLAAEQVTIVAMESTGSYWKPVWQVLEDAGLDQVLVNARHVKHVPGRKTDVKDAVWLAELLEAGLLARSFVPPRWQRQLRDLTRYRKRLVQDRTRESQRVDKTLEDAAIKLGSVASSTLTKSGRAMIEALIAGERDPDQLAELARGRMRAKIPELVRALNGTRFNDHHAAVLRGHLDHIDYLDMRIAELDDRIDGVLEPYADVRNRLTTIVGIDKRVAEVIIAEIGVDMSVFPTSAHLASWAAQCPGNHESAGKHYSGRTRPGNKWLTDALTQAAWAAARSKDSYLSAHFWRIARRRGNKKAARAVAHTILVIAYHLIERGTTYEDLGGDYFARRLNKDRRTNDLVRQLEALGHTVTLEPTA